MRDNILDVAEEIFSNLGYAGTTLREVSAGAQVTQALINYYFGSKFGLFSEVFLRRAAPVSKERVEQLETLRAKGQDKDIRAIVRAFLQPSLALRETRQGRAFLRLQSRLHTEPPNLSYELRRNAYAESTQLYIEAFQQALPKLSRLDVHWRVTLMIGAYLYAFSDTHRMEDMVPEQYDPDDTDALMEQIVRFISSGMK